LANLEQIIEFLSKNVSDPVQEYIMVKEIYKELPSNYKYKNTYTQIKKSKWYLDLADEQLDDGSWGRFHSQDSKMPKRKFVTTETALKRARELSLSKDDPVIAKCIKLMERYVRGEKTWSDNIEKHRDGGKSHLHSRPFVTAANINLFDSKNSVIKSKRDVFIKTLKIALLNGYFNEEAWELENKNYSGPCLTGWNAYPLMILQNIDCLDDTIQKQYLDYIWHRKGGIYYISDFPPSEKRNLENKDFTIWLSLLEILSGFSLFSEYMKKEAFSHLLQEATRLMNRDIELPVSNTIFGHYAESWRNKNLRKIDMILRIVRILIKC
jgi:hypothetical protein